MKWKRSEKQTGLAAIGANDSIRPMYLYGDTEDEWLGEISNPAQGWHSDAKSEW